MRSRVVRAKKRAKVLLFFDMTKFSGNFFSKICIFAIGRTKKRAFRAPFLLIAAGD